MEDNTKLLAKGNEMEYKQILKYLDSDEKLDIRIRLFISALNSHNFTEQQYRRVDIVEKELERQIPNETKQSIYSKCNKDRNVLYSKRREKGDWIKWMIR